METSVILAPFAIVVMILATCIFFCERLRAARRQAEARAVLAERAKSDLVMNMSHELRTPLTAIIGFSEIMRSEMMGPMGNPLYLDYAGVIETAGQRLLAVINDILEIAAVEVGTTELVESMVELHELANHLVAVVRGAAEQGRVAVTVQPMPDLPLLRGDGPRIKRILMNLLSNAITYTPPGGSVEVSAGIAADGSLRLEVRDTGIGIAAADIERLMAPFTLGENVQARRYQGHGLGLPIARHLAELHGGSLILQSDSGKGTTAIVTFPPERVIATPLAQDGLEQIIL